MKNMMSAGELVFRRYRASDKETIISLLGGGRPAGYVDGKRKVFDWQFFENPETAAEHSFIVGTVDEQIVAVNGLMPVRVLANGKAVDACWSLDTYVSDKYRGRGFGKALLKRVTESSPIMLGFGISDMSDPILAKFGWVLDESMAVMFYHCSETGVKGAVKNLLTQTRRFASRLRGPDPCRASVEDRVPAAELDELWSRVSPQFGYAVIRDARYLHWRYSRSPVMRYRWVVARKAGQIQAVLVIRHEGVESVLADYVGPLDDRALLESVIGAGVKDLSASGTRRVRCEANHPAVLDALSRNGFRRFRSASRFRVHALAETEKCEGKWFVMTGDSDNDLLSV